MAPIDLAHLEDPVGFESQHFYTTEVEKNGKTFHRLSFGYFNDKQSVVAAAGSFREQYPNTWYSKVSPSVAAVEAATVPNTGEPTATAALLPKEPPVNQPGTAPERREKVAAVGEPTDEGRRDQEQKIEFDFDGPPDTRYEITPHLALGAELETDIRVEHNFDLDQDQNVRDEATIEPQLSIALSYDPNDRVRAFGELELSREIFADQPDRLRDRKTRLEVKRAYVTLRDLLPGVTAQLGRQRFEDELEWFYDERLDAGRLYFRDGRYGGELSVSREQLVGEDLLNNDRKKDINNYIAAGRASIGEDSEAAAFIIFRDDRESNPEDLLFFGLQSTGELARDLEYWAQFAHVRGDARSNNISGFGVDLGATYVLNLPFKPAITIGGAFGTGDSDPNDGTDENFRQTGLQDNNAKFNGVTSFKYYGEVFDPELSNMAILTAGLGVRPTRKSSIDLVYHHYWQAKEVDDLRDSPLDADPNGEHRDLGHELDLVFGLREFGDLAVELIFGMFIPGNGFDENDIAYFVGSEIVFEF